MEYVEVVVEDEVVLELLSGNVLKDEERGVVVCLKVDEEKVRKEVENVRMMIENGDLYDGDDGWE